MPDNSFLNAFSQPEPQLESALESRGELLRQPKAIQPLTTPDAFRGGLFNRPDLSSIQAGFAFREAIEAGSLGTVQQFIDAGIFDHLNEQATQQAVGMIQSVKDIQARLTTDGIERFGGMRRILREGLPGEQKPQTIQTPKGPQQKLVQAPERKEFIAQQIDAATGDERERLLREESELQQAFQGKFGVEKAPGAIKERPVGAQRVRAAKRDIGRLPKGEPVPEHLKAIVEGRAPAKAGKGPKRITVSPGQIIVDEAGKVIFEAPQKDIRRETREQKLGEQEAAEQIGARQAGQTTELIRALGGSTEILDPAGRAISAGVPISRVESLISTFSGIDAKTRRDKLDEQIRKDKKEETILKRKATEARSGIERARLGTSINSTFQTNSDVRRFTAIDQATRSINELSKQEPTEENKAFIQQAMIVLFNKVTDPLSVVRESEYERTPQNIAWINRLEGAITKIYQGGAGITQDDLDALVFAVNVIRNEATGPYNAAISRFGDLAELGGVPRRLVGRGIANPFPLPGEVRGAAKKITDFSGKSDEEVLREAGIE